MSDPSWAERPWEDPKLVAGAKASKAKERRTAAIWVAVILLAIAGCSVKVATGLTSHQSRPPASADAGLQCQEWVKEKLKSPSTASFSSRVVSGGPTSWTAKGDVDSQNSYGATVRSSWTCEISVSGDHWTGTTRLIE